MTELTEPGIYEMPEDEYHADPVPGGSLSSSGARRLLPPSCPALFRHEQLNARPSKREFDFGHAAHAKVLGIGAPIVAVDADDWRTKAAKEGRDQAYADGHTPVLAREVETIDAMAAAIREHPIAAALFDPDRGGRAEQSIFWVDDRHGVWRRARLDWLPQLTPSGRLIIPDYKTTTSAENRAVARKIADLGYHQQAAWYSDAARAMGLAEDVAFVFVFQEKTAPYLVNVVELDGVAMQLGRGLNERALTTYRRCTDSGHWPGYSDDVELVSLPTYAQIQQEALLA